ncbi:hypothetical protein LSAT2_005488 [Lamellibrachia satsuma]|nr:hypothetical protein LSAT2_005488 [Lamellibrachia satsuma]
MDLHPRVPPQYSGRVGLRWIPHRQLLPLAAVVGVYRHAAVTATAARRSDGALPPHRLRLRHRERSCVSTQCAATIMGEFVQVQLRRMETSQSWGFRLRGGTDQGIPLHVEQVNPQGRASQTGLQQGDEVVAICHTDVTRMAHNEVKREILRAGNELDLTVRRGELTGSVPPQQRQRVEVCEEPTQRIGGPTYKPVQPKTYKVLDEQLASGQAQEAAKPSSIFDRKRQERSAYLQAKGCTIQKAFGEG